MHTRFGALVGGNVTTDLDLIPERLRAFARFQGRIAELTAEPLAEACRRCESILRSLQRATTLAEASLAVDRADAGAGALLDRCERLWSLVAAEAEFFDREVAAIPPARLAELLTEPSLAPFANHLRKIQTASTLIPDEATADLLARTDSTADWEALARRLLDRIRPHRSGRATALGELLPELYRAERRVRSVARDAVSASLEPEVELRAAALTGLSAARWGADSARGARDRLDFALLAEQVPGADIGQLLDRVRGSTGIMHRYYEAKAELLGGLDDADRYAPLADVPEQRISFAEAAELVLDAFGEVSPVVQRCARQLLADGNVEADPHPGKRAGAATYSLPGGPSLVVVNFRERLRDVLLLGHELGHAVHARLCSGRTVFEQAVPSVLAETVGLFFEAVVADRSIRQAGDPARTRVALARWLEDQMVATFRSAALHDLESDLYGAVATGERPDEEWIGERWLHHQRSIYGPAVSLDPGYRHWWSYIEDLYFSPGTRFAYPYGQLVARAMFAEHQASPLGFADRLVTLLESGASAPPGTLLRRLGLEPDRARVWDAGLLALDHEVAGLVNAARHADVRPEAERARGGLPIGASPGGGDIP